MSDGRSIRPRRADALSIARLSASSSPRQPAPHANCQRTAGKTLVSAERDCAINAKSRGKRVLLAHRRGVFIDAGANTFARHLALT